jgi:DNA-binding MarR family transcriptional regulator
LPIARDARTTRGTIAAMPHRRSERPDVTPAGGLDEAKLHQLLGYQLAQAAIATSGVFTRLVGDVHQLRPVEYTILALVKENPDGSSSRLAKALGVTAPNITMWIDRLEKRGLVQRQASTTDRRAQQLRVTAKGAQLADKATRQLLAGEHAEIEGLTAGERAILIELLHKVACNRRG